MLREYPDYAFTFARSNTIREKYSTMAIKAEITMPSHLNTSHFPAILIIDAIIVYVQTHTTTAYIMASALSCHILNPKSFLPRLARLVKVPPGFSGLLSSV